MTFSQQQIARHQLIERLIRRAITEQEAADLLGKSVRQVRRMKQRVLISGITGLTHRNRGKHPWNKLDTQMVDRIVSLYISKYKGFNCLHFRDMLEEHEGIRVKRESLRLLFLAHDFPRKRRRVQRRFERRERKPQAGMLIQQDTSFHDWFSVGKTYALVASIDDATSEVVYARFGLTDGTLPNMEAMKTVVEEHGIPVAFYVDQASHFRTTRHESIHVQLTGVYDDTQIARALKEVGSTLILALSPQAKGRVERLFETLQDRLIKELALAEIKTIADGNTFLRSWLPGFNRRFSVHPTNQTSAYRPVPNHLRLALIFSVQEERMVRADNTISFEGKTYLVSAAKTRPSFAKATITVHRLITGDVRLFYKGQELAYTIPWTNSLGS